MVVAIICPGTVVRVAVMLIVVMVVMVTVVVVAVIVMPRVYESPFSSSLWWSELTLVTSYCPRKTGAFFCAGSYPRCRA